jgi:phosphoribosylformylglycinamidine cyclo-ligase
MATQEDSGQSIYAKLGVDADKTDVRKAFSSRIDNEYPKAFVNIITDPFRRDWAKTLHMDGDGSKFIQRLLVCSETGDPEVLKGAVDDAWQMNLGDIAASGFVFGPILVGDILNLNRFNVDKKLIMDQVGERFGELKEMYRRFGFKIFFMGGETADLPVQVVTEAFDGGVAADAKKRDLITGNVQPGDKIYGFASDGQAIWEEKPNSGIMSNGLTLAQTCTMWSGYREQYPKFMQYTGKYKVGEKAPPPYDFVVSDALTSPTRHWALLIRLLLEELKRNGGYEDLHGISMNTGGGATKISHVGSGITYEKIMPNPPDLFQFIQGESGEEWKDMFKDFNCGVGLDIVGADNFAFRNALQRVSDMTHVELYDLGGCKKSDDGENHVALETEQGLFTY